MTSRAPRAPWQGRRVVLGVCGGIAAYKAVQLARDLTLLGSEVDVVMTRSARRFIAPLSFEGVTGRAVLSGLWSVEGSARHLALAAHADAVVVAPATADLVARAAQGRADDLLATVLLATAAPIVLCPAMNHRMWAHPQVQQNIAQCRDRFGHEIAGPGEGELGAGEGRGVGRMLEPAEIVMWVGRALTRPGRLAGQRIMVTAGPTHEALDPVRYLGNRSSGRMGYALAQAAWLQGGEVHLISGPSSLPDPVGVEVTRVESARQMFEAVQGAEPRADVVVHAAAVADFRPEQTADSKLKRSRIGTEMKLSLVANPDIAAQTAPLLKADAVAIGFALETDQLRAHAATKLEAKKFDLIAANDARDPDAGFEVETNRVTLLGRDGSAEELPLASKAEVAELILDRAADLLAAKRGGEPVQGARS